MELIDETLFLIRRENSPTELIQGVRGYGHTFPEACTTWDFDVKLSTSHQRLLRYNFGGLDLLVRFEADGYLPMPNNEASTPLFSPTKTSGPLGIDDLTESFKASKVETEKNTTISSSGHDTLTVKHTGKDVGQESIFDLKTRALWKKSQDLLSEEIPRLWVAQISNFVAAYHEKGEFKPENIVIQNVKADVIKWEKDHKSSLAQLAALLHILISKARELKDGRFEICRSEGGALELRRQLADAGDALSSIVKEEWVRSSEYTEKVDSEEDATNKLSWDDGPENDYTACTSACRYCGRCTY